MPSRLGALHLATWVGLVILMWQGTLNWRQAVPGQPGLKQHSVSGAHVSWPEELEHVLLQK